MKINFEVKFFILCCKLKILIGFIYNKKENKKPSNTFEGFGAAGGIRIPDLSVRSRVLYPAKLLLHVDIKSTITL